jgi:hypothetical protein
MEPPSTALRPPESLSRCEGFARVSGRHEWVDGDSLSLEAPSRVGY